MIVAKHLCGVASDLALKALDQLPRGKWRGLALATNAKFPVESASWRVDSDKGGSTLRCLLTHGGLSVSDCVLEAGELYLSIPLFPPATVSRKEGLLSIIAYRFGIRKERRLVGVFLGGF